MVRILLSEDVFGEPTETMEIVLVVEEKDLVTLINIARANKIDLAVLKNEE